MKVEHLKKLPAILLSVFLIAAPAAPAMAAKPYFKTFGSDVMTGGWFSTGNTCSTGALYQDPSTPPANDLNGGILAFAKTIGGSGKPVAGASSQYGVFSLGTVDGNSADHGFYGAGADGSNIRVDGLTFANTNPGSAPWGGLFEGSTRQGNCIPDYYAQKPASASTISSGTPLNSLTSGSYVVTPAAGTNYSLTGGPATVGADVKINIYVNGSVYIGSNIFYGASTADHVPKFRIVAKGNIYIDPGVSNIDGWYVAQPAGSGAGVVTADDGMVWTCHVNDQAKPTDSFIVSNCGNKLVVNGALTAKQYNLLRLNGDVTLAAPAEDGLNNALGNANIAEIVNYTPAMVIGGGFIDSSTSGTGTLPYDSLISLPPVF